MKKMRFVCMGVLVLLTLTACSISASREQECLMLQDISLKPVLKQVLHQYKKVTPEKAQDMMSENVIILDVRTQEEYDEGHIENAILLLDDEVVEGAKTVIADKNQIILVYSQTNARSEKAAMELIGLGYREIYDFGSIADWRGEIVGNWAYPSYYNYFGGELPPDIVTPIDFAETIKVNEKMPEFTVHLTGENIKGYGANYDKARYYIISSENHIKNITITDDKGDLVQNIGDLSRGNESLEKAMYGLVFEDWNFDGYMDIGLSANCDGAIRSEPFYYWLWDDRLRRFVKNEELMEISEEGIISINKEEHLLRCYTYYGLCNEARYYKYVKDKFVLVCLEEEIEGSEDKGVRSFH
ncbi:rhodanese-like domain-containing protein [Anaerosporobacter sp.]|uniref:rhodanese-like domain-containing protein n=1 Tax=Anaerosporobacter sp. TaxID=1872529 RepID=UPI00286F3662|nr:rhodanese-like domain-containing protein [Anaerosporobacter sp.]